MSRAQRGAPHRVVEISGGDARWAQRVRATWPPGATLACLDAERPVGVVRIGVSAPGEGYHREHVRTLHVDAEDAALDALLAAAVATCEHLRLELEAPAGRPALERALASAGLELEACCRGAWFDSGRALDLQHWGRAPRGRARKNAPARGRPRRPDDGGVADLRVVRHDSTTREALAAFLDGLTPGRAYPPGTLLSEAEHVETRRPGDLDATWLLALDPSGAVVGGCVLEPDPRPERRLVRRVHLDVLRAFRRRGVATRLLRAAREEAARLGLSCLEADPRDGSSARGPLERAGFRVVGRLRGAWRMRSPDGAWDEDVVLYQAPALHRA